MGDRNQIIIASLTFIALLLFGPTQSTGLVVRFAYLLLIPMAVWFGLRRFRERWGFDPELDERISRALIASLSGVLFVFAYHRLNLTHHLECSQWVPSRDGQECVGDDVVVKGGDLAGAAISLLSSCFAFWLAISKRDES